MTKAFSLIELIFVIVIIGIISSFVIPSIKTNPLQEAAIQLASDIRYTQHLAMNDDLYRSNENNWFENRWRLKFYNGIKSDNKLAYTICNKEDSHTNVNANNVAKNPLDSNQLLSGGHSSSSAKLNINDEAFIGMYKLNLGKSYNISSYSLSGGCRYSRINFDFLGRPIYRDPNKLTKVYKEDDKEVLVHESCQIKLSTINHEEIKIIIEAETGRVKIIY